MRGTLDQGFWVTPVTAHLEIYRLCMNINTRCDLVIAGRLGASLREWSSLLIFDDTGCRFGGGCWGAVGGRGAGGCGGGGVRTATSSGQRVIRSTQMTAEIAAAHVYVTMTARAAAADVLARKWPSCGLRQRIGQWQFRSLPASVFAQKLLSCPLSLACALRMLSGPAPLYCQLSDC